MKFAKNFAKNPKPAVRPTRPNKTTESYWMSKVHRTYSTAPFNVRMMHQGEARNVSLGTTLQRIAAKRAAKLYLDIKQAGWGYALKNLEEARGKKLIGTSSKDGAGTPNAHTVSWFIQESRNTFAPTVAESTLSAYTTALRCIVRESMGTTKATCKQAEEQPIAMLTRARVEQWRTQRFQQFANEGLGGEALDRKKRTINATIRNAKSLFSSTNLEAIARRTNTPILPNPFNGLKPISTSQNKYVTKIEVTHLVPAAMAKLKRDISHEEGLPAASWVIFLLAFYAGLRANEIDKLEWSMVDFDRKIISIRPTDCFKAKSASSNAEVPIEDDVLVDLQWYRDQCPKKSKFVICPHLSVPVGKKGPERRRLNLAFNYLSDWLRNYTHEGAKPLKLVQKPTHELRKEAGSVIMRNGDIFKASIFLRHADIHTTVRHYADSRSRITLGLGHLLRASSQERTPAEHDSRTLGPVLESTSD